MLWGLKLLTATQDETRSSMLSTRFYCIFRGNRHISAFEFMYVTVTAD